VRDYCMLLLMFRHGLRVSELCAMRLSDVNVTTKELHVKRLKGCDSGPNELYNGESGAIKAWLSGARKDESSGRLRYAFYQRTAQTVIAMHRVGND
jgi:site-specific recombinase XerC